VKEFEPLYRELDEWNFDGEEVMLWWRDDDAVEDTSSLQQLLTRSSNFSHRCKIVSNRTRWYMFYSMVFSIRVMHRRLRKNRSCPGMLI